MLNYLLVGLGGAIVSVLRFGFSGLIANRFGQTFPWGTLFVNVTGCFMTCSTVQKASWSQFDPGKMTTPNFMSFPSEWGFQIESNTNKTEGQCHTQV